MVMKYYIYVIQNKVNNKIYVGKSGNLDRRWKEHIKISSGGKEKYGKNFRAIHAALAKYGKVNFNFLDIDQFDDEIEAYEAEEFWIEYFQSHRKEIGYNETMGGKGALSGSKHPMYGTHPSDETRLKLSRAKKGKKPTLGIKQTATTRAAWSLQRQGNGNGMYGKHHSDEGKTNISEAKLASPKNKGESHYSSTITNEQAAKIRELFVSGNTKAEIAKIFNVRWLTIHRIVINETYKVNQI